MMNVAILASSLIAAATLYIAPFARTRLWQATITPLASIIGSGFLIVGPILIIAFGGWAPIAMAVLCLIAWVFGSAIRFNIKCRDQSTASVRALDGLSEWALAFAYVISVAYYLNLFGSFALSLTSFGTEYHVKALTTAVYLLILFVGMTRGLAGLESMEKAAVGLKLAIISGLIVGLALYFGQTAQDGELTFRQVSTNGWAEITLLLGLIVTVQGFETSRYLGESYTPKEQVSSMRLAQILSSAIYLMYILLLTYVFAPDSLATDETAIIEMMQIVAPVLPFALIVAALAAQFSAAVADMNGAGGLVNELSRKRIPTRFGYAVLVCAGVGITWTADVFEIISYASRAFAIYYAFQCAIAILNARRTGKARLSVFFLLALATALLAVVFGSSVE